MSQNTRACGPPEFTPHEPEITGHCGEHPPHCPEPATTGKRPPAQAWIDAALRHDTQRVWSKALGRPVSEEEALEILMNVKRLAELMFAHTRRKEDHDECGDLGAGLVPRTAGRLLD